MTVSELFRAGRLKEAIDAQVQEVKTNPLDHGKRLFLFELSVFAGDLERARRQIDAVNYGDPALDMAALAYRKLIDVEETRRKLYGAGPLPQFLEAPPEHAKLRLEALQLLRQKKIVEARALLEQADEKAPAVAGQLNGKPFSLIRDCDDLFGSVLEMVAQGSYYWVPFEQLATVSIREPKNPRDLIWCSARVQLRAGHGGDVFLPALYPDSASSDDMQLKLGRATDWTSEEGGPVRGVGTRQLLVDDDAVNLVDWRELQIS